MALLNPVDQARSFVKPSEVRLNWRLLAALVATVGFWVTVGETVARLI